MHTDPEQEVTINNKGEIIISHPQCVASISQTKFAIANINYLYIINFSSATPTTISHNFIRASDIALNADRSLCLLSGAQHLKAYDTKTDDLQYQSTFNTVSTKKRPITCDPKNLQQSLCRHDNLLVYEDLSNKNKAKLLELFIPNKSTAHYFVSHPIQENTFLECGQSDNASHKKCYEYFINPTEISPGVTITTTHYYIQENALSAEYNSDGSMIIINTADQGILVVNKTVNTNDNKPFQLNINHDPNSPAYQAITPHPNKVIAALLTYNNIIEYWNCLTKEKVAQIDLDPLKEMEIIKDDQPLKRLAFSPNGKKNIAALHNICLILDVPISAALQGDTKEQSITALLSLQKYAQKYAEKNNLPDNAIPQDIISLILQIYWNLD
jgi:hypothetical protein